MNSIDKPYTLHAAEEPTQDRTSELNVGDHLDAIVHGPTELLGDPHLIAVPAPVQSARSTFALDADAVPEHVEPDASAATRTITIAIAIRGAS
jgi:hypothetical protein